MKKTKVAKKLLGAMGYARAPKAMFLLKHPIKGASALLAYRAAKKLAPKRRTVVAATATAIAVPFLWRSFRTDGES